MIWDRRVVVGEEVVYSSMCRSADRCLSPSPPATGASADGESDGQAGGGAGGGERPGRSCQRVHEGHRLHQPLQEHEGNTRYGSVNDMGKKSVFLFMHPSCNIYTALMQLHAHSG